MVDDCARLSPEVDDKSRSGASGKQSFHFRRMLLHNNSGRSLDPTSFRFGTFGAQSEKTADIHMGVKTGKSAANAEAASSPKPNA